MIVLPTKNKQDEHLQVLGDVSKWCYEQNCRTSLEYFKYRNLTKEVVQKFRLGFFPTAFGSLLQKCTNPAVLRDLWIVYDAQASPFTERVIFPVYDVHNNVVAISGRVLMAQNTKVEKKYVNTVYDKRHHLFGINVAQEAIRSQNRAYVVEGQVCVLSAHSRGLSNVVAMTGKVLSLQQARLLARYCDEIVILPDNEPEAIAKARESTQLIKSQCRIRYHVLSTGKDLDEYFNVAQRTVDDFNNETMLIPSKREQWRTRLEKLKHVS